MNMLVVICVRVWKWILHKNHW